MYAPSLFPEAERVIYRKNPLQSVICELRFPPILRIESALPAQFQDEIRGDFPLFNDGGNRGELALPATIEQLIPQDLRQALNATDKRPYEFVSRDRTWTVSLSRDSVALQAKAYKCWEDFARRLDLIVNSFITVYTPDSFSRLGLRYQNAIDRKALELDDMPWCELISPEVLGLLGKPDHETWVAEQNGVFSVALNDAGDFIRVSYGLARGGEAPDDGPVYLLDNDLFTSNEVPAEVNDVASRASEFNRLNRNFFRWCILEPLHTAMGPEPAT